MPVSKIEVLAEPLVRCDTTAITALKDHRDRSATSRCYGPVQAALHHNVPILKLTR
jgi:hypothetical protein